MKIFPLILLCMLSLSCNHQKDDYEKMDQNYKTALKLLRDHDVNTALPNGDFPIHIFIQNSDEDSVVRAIKQEADINSIDGMGRSPLMISIIKKNSTMNKILLDNKSDIDAVDKIGNGIPEYCIFSDDIQVIKYLLKNRKYDKARLLKLISLSENYKSFKCKAFLSQKLQRAYT